MKLGYTSIVKDLSNGDEDKMNEVACSIYRCLQEQLVYSNYPNVMWGRAVIYDVSFKGFSWLENN